MTQKTYYLWDMCLFCCKINNSSSNNNNINNNNNFRHRTCVVCSLPSLYYCLVAIKPWRMCQWSSICYLLLPFLVAMRQEPASITFLSRIMQPESSFTRRASLEDCWWSALLLMYRERLSTKRSSWSWRMGWQGAESGMAVSSGELHAPHFS